MLEELAGGRRTNSCTTCGAVIFVCFLHFSALWRFPLRIVAPVCRPGTLRVRSEGSSSRRGLNRDGGEMLEPKFASGASFLRRSCSRGAELAVSVAPLPSGHTGRPHTRTVNHALVFRFFLSLFFLFGSNNSLDVPFRPRISPLVCVPPLDPSSECECRGLQNGTCPICHRAAPRQNCTFSF